MSKRFLTLLVCLTALLSLSAFAVDGVVLINQASVNAAGGFPYKITVSGSYKLSSNLTISSAADAIDVLADNVTIDLNGFSIMGPVTCDGDSTNTTTSCTGSGGNGIFVFQNNVTIRNGTIQGMGTGIRQQGAGVLVEELHVYKNSQTGIAVTLQGVVRRNTASNNGVSGISAQASVVSENVVTGNKESGISGSVSTVTNNTAWINGGSGINTGFSKVRDNVSAFNGGFGLHGVNGLLGSNSFSGNALGSLSGTSVSQNNNNCNGTAC